MKNNVIIQEGFDLEQYAFCGNQFLTGNGYMGLRGTLCEYTKAFLPAINLAGVYDQVGNQWRESVNAPNALYANILVNGKRYALPESSVKSHEMKLDIHDGILYRTTVFLAEEGEITFSTQHMVSMAEKNLILQGLTINLSFDAEVCFVLGIDTNIWDINGPHLEKFCCSAADHIITAQAVTHEKNIPVTVQEKCCYGFSAEESCEISDVGILRTIRFRAVKDGEYTVKKQICVTVGDQNVSVADFADFETEKAKHMQAWHSIWDTSYIEIEGDEEAERSLNYSIYHLNCIAPRHSRSMSIPARGLSGQVYKGAVFWDTEMFMLDYYLYTQPDIARTLLMYRIDTLPGAMEKAKSYGYQGAFYAWESQEYGYDACSDYNIVDVFTKRPMRTFFRDKQVHISAAVVYALVKYVDITNDTTILTGGGAQVILECARFYRSLLLKREGSACYEIHDVVGPDEYHERVNNNAYTNAMAKFVFESVLTCQQYLTQDISEYAELAEKIYIPAPNAEGVIEQFDGYFKLEDCRVADVKARLLDPKEYWGGAYGVASQTQVIKQADVIAMMCMLKERYTVDEMKANLAFYEPRTEHGSSLSACMYSLLSCYTGDPDFAYPFFLKSAGADLRPGAKEWMGLIYIGGTHPASEGGAWMVAVKGFAGLEIENGKIKCTPNLPKGWSAMRFKVNYQNNRYQITVKPDDWSVTAV